MDEIGGFPKIRVTIFGVPIVKIIVLWGLYSGPLVSGDYHFGVCGRGWHERGPCKCVVPSSSNVEKLGLSWHDKNA